LSDVELQIIPLDSRIPGITHGLDYLDQLEKDAFLSYPDLKGEPMDVETPFAQCIEADLDLLQQMDGTECQDITGLITRIEDGFLNSWEEPVAPIINIKTFLLK